VRPVTPVDDWGSRARVCITLQCRALPNRSDNGDDDDGDGGSDGDGGDGDAINGLVGVFARHGVGRDFTCKLPFFTLCRMF
jgi:hypothetical protein